MISPTQVHVCTPHTHIHIYSYMDVSIDCLLGLFLTVTYLKKKNKQAIADFYYTAELLPSENTSAVPIIGEDHGNS